MKRLGPSLALILLAGALFWQAGRRQQALLPMREVISPGQADIAENMPPMVAFVTIALGGFRGLIADALWLRSTRMQEEGRYFELVQLSDWITKLEPRFTPVWSFQAWNMSYNISVLMNEPADRWRWVRHGFEMLRDEAITYNPGDAMLYWHLGWIYQHKMGQDLDQAHHFYKDAWAREMMDLFNGQSAPDYETLLSDDPAAAPLRDRMIEDYKLDPAIMQEVDNQYGPLDWRLPDAHAVYWAFRGLPHAEGFAKIQMHRMINQSLASAFRKGKAFVGLDGQIRVSPNPDLFPRARTAYLESRDDFPSNESFQTAHMNFLIEAIAILNSYNRTREARNIYRELKELYPGPQTDKGFEYFSAALFVGSIEELTARKAQAMVEGSILQSLGWYAIGDEDRYAGFAVQSRRIYQQFMNKLSPGEHEERMGLPPYPELYQLALNRLLAESDNPEIIARLEALRGPVRAPESR